MRRYHVTFGSRFRTEPHPTYARATPEGWVDVVAPNEAAARAVAVGHLGSAWSMIYAEDDPSWDPVFFPAGCVGTLGASGWAVS